MRAHYGITQDDLYSQPKKHKPGQPRFVHGERSWTGQGPRPGWLKELLEAGGQLEDYEVA